MHACHFWRSKIINQHENISYTIEKSKNILQFLDAAVQINDKGVDTWVWRKPINTGLFLNFKAVCPLNWKSGLISYMLHRAKMIYSNDTLFLKEVNQLGSLFLVNNYTLRFFDKVFKKFMAKNHPLPNHFSYLMKKILR